MNKIRNRSMKIICDDMMIYLTRCFYKIDKENSNNLSKNCFLSENQID